MAGLRTETKRKLTAKQLRIVKLIESHGTLAQFARDLSAVTGKEVVWTTVYHWVRRGAISKRMIVPVHKVTGVPLEKLL